MALRMDSDLYLRAVLDAIPSLVFIIDSGMQVVDANDAAKTLFAAQSDMVLKRLCGEVLHCLHQVTANERCGQTELCDECLIKQAVNASSASSSVHRQKYRMVHQMNGISCDVDYLVTVSPVAYGGDRFFLLVLEDVTELLALRRLATLCSYCNRIRNDEGGWEQVHHYLARKQNLVYSHGMCPSCLTEERSRMKP